MIPVRTNKTIHTHQHIRTVHSIFTSTGPKRDRWPRLRETEQIHYKLRHLYRMRQEQRQERICYGRRKK